ncbi:hypothetical protein Psch_02189 [Pelotomaculum schinkii]|uniref:DNA repair protein RadA n=1 Tax=Pelotomaculum schinkii TaxID=78350 RepID=A0A4Y7RII5_9FIRM|nr:MULTISPECIES: AAA family ATPase [Pelotomaculum]TEB08623.1 hypothetical protein Psch_02189 [Pelotomaculum schinkii]TEB16818.1 hypothetical protein Psfp_00980 [Pelotomaculum sp. FP]
MTYEDFLSKLQGVRGKTALCPAHDDKQRSLSHSVKDGKILLHCHAGCSVEDIVTALGLKVSDLFLDEPARKSTMDIVEEYNYKDTKGNLAYQVVRLSPKSFRQRRPKGRGGWLWNMQGVKPLPYRLPELLAALERGETVFIVEGEKDVDNLLVKGLVATTNHGGAGKWNEAHSEYFPSGSEVVILPDNDEPGREHAHKVAIQLVGRGCHVKLVELPDLPEKGDVSDWLGSGGTKEELLVLVERTQEFRLQESGQEKDNLPIGYTAQGIMETEFPEPRWLIPGLLCEGLSLLCGRPKMGKSWLCLAIASAVAAGGWALGCKKVERSEVLYLALEDTPRRLKGRLEKILQNGQAPVGFHIFTEWKKLDQGGLELLDKWLTVHPNCKLVVIDTFGKIRGKISSSGSIYQEDYGALDGLKRLADSYGVSVLLVHHLRKMGSDDPLETISGSTGISGAADGILILKRERGASGASLYITGRDVEEQELALNFDQTIGTWAILGDAAEYRLSQERRDILEVLRKAKEAMSPKEIAEVVGRKGPNVRKTIEALLDEGLINKVGYGKYYISQQGFSNKENNEFSLHSVHTLHSHHTGNSVHTNENEGSVNECDASVNGSVNAEIQQRRGKLASVNSVNGVSRDNLESILNEFAGQEVDLNDFPL